MRAVAWGLTDVGLQREHNEDSFVVLKEYDLFVVADGMGGHRAGDVASKLATETISEFFRSTANDDVTWPFHFDANLSEEENRLLTGIRVANRQIFERSTRSREYHGMGTTVVGAMFSPRKGRMYIGHVGDSRCYRIRGGQIQLLTRDHSLFNDYLLAMPDLTEEQRRELPKNVITRALGMQDQVAVDLQHDESQAADVYVLCSDGLSGMVTDEEILAIVQNAQAGHGSGSMADAPKKLIERANERGGEDNVTAVVIAIEDDAIESTGPAKAMSEDLAGAMSTRSANAATEVPPPGSQPGSQLGPPVPVDKPDKKMSSEFTEDPTLPAIDLRKHDPSSLGEEPTLPAIDLTKELAAIKKQRGE
ncbi:MAG TPA: Stp1/IreP family PP2C-type Ser/Thr phosphatase [Polyangiaceae bacterium]|jgi:protein phosphatase|nr:Stp1/IreP family PP2C-type Ser/Thr phosphatase [Polyangiaceae bacterium]